MNTKIALTILISVTILLGTSLWIASSGLITSPYDTLLKGNEGDEKFVSPKTVSLFLRKSYDDKRDIILEASTYAGGGCDQVSDLQTTIEENSQSVILTIEGYTIKEYRGINACLAVVHSASTEVIVTEFIKSGGREVIVILDGVPNAFTLQPDDGQIQLNPVDASNVISHKQGLNQPTKAQPVSISAQ